MRIWGQTGEKSTAAAAQLLLLWPVLHASTGASKRLESVAALPQGDLNHLRIAETTDALRILKVHWNESCTARDLPIKPALPMSTGTGQKHRSGILPRLQLIVPRLDDRAIGD